VVRSPSEKLDREEDHAPKPGADDAGEGGGEAARAYGVVAHRVLETFATGGAAPPLRAVVAGLIAEGLAQEEAEPLARRLLESAGLAWRDAGFARLREGAILHPEWPLEQSEGADLWVGRLDLVVEGTDEVSVVDYKTSALGDGQPAEAFKETVRAAYAAQLKRYAGMVAALPEFRGRKVRAYLLLTELSGDRLVEV
jgi:ATP-dependent exoDNAse (exonuclease V) beta subunit